MVATAAPPRRQRRVKLKSNSSTVGEYRYDALGRRVEKVVTGATYRYVYSGVETVSVYTSTGTWKQDYVYGPGIDEVLMLEQADVLDWDGDSNTSETARSWYLRNALGSVMEVLEQDKTEAVSYRYDPYGNLTITRGGASQSSDPLGQYLTYLGRWRDEAVAVYGSPYGSSYVPATGRSLALGMQHWEHDWIPGSARLPVAGIPGSAEEEPHAGRAQQGDGRSFSPYPPSVDGGGQATCQGECPKREDDPRRIDYGTGQGWSYHWFRQSTEPCRDSKTGGRKTESLRAAEAYLESIQGEIMRIAAQQCRRNGMANCYCSGLSVKVIIGDCTAFKTSWRPPNDPTWRGPAPQFPIQQGWDLRVQFKVEVTRGVCKL